jgi:hypothetical protein
LWVLRCFPLVAVPAGSFAASLRFLLRASLPRASRCMSMLGFCGVECDGGLCVVEGECSSLWRRPFCVLWLPRMPATCMSCCGGMQCVCVAVGREAVECKAVHLHVPRSCTRTSMLPHPANLHMLATARRSSGRHATGLLCCQQSAWQAQPRSRWAAYLPPRCVAGAAGRLRGGRSCS